MSGTWRQWLALATGVMGIRPADFWRLSFLEWQALADGYALRGGPRLPAPLARDELAVLAADFPDEKRA